MVNPRLTALVDSEHQQLRISSAQPDKVSIAETVNYILKQDTTHFDTQTTHFDTIIHEKKKQQQQLHIPFQQVKAAAIEKMANKHQGITYLDILKLADNPTYTPKQAMELLRNHRKSGNLHTVHRTKPQQYYLSKADAEYSGARTTYIDPRGYYISRGEYQGWSKALCACANGDNS